MKCFCHHDRDAVAQCSKCGKFLCSECAEVWEPPLCPSCGKSTSSYNKSSAVSSLILTVILFVIGGLFAGHMYSIDNSLGFSLGFGEKLFGIVLFGYVFAAIPSGWRALSGITSKFFLILPVVGWLIYFGIKLGLSFIVGLVMLPVETVKAIRTLKRG
ncbi:MAG: hypothetical protein K2N60_00480 [Oscillospiraceae bacterium]|nr:hypothetical protein [Oscillospiraceae bacterium]